MEKLITTELEAEFDETSLQKEDWHVLHNNVISIYIFKEYDPQ